MILDIFSKLGNNPLTWDIILALIFLVGISIFLIKNKKDVKLEKMAFPLFYAILYRGNFGIKWMEKFAKKHTEKIKLFGLISVGVGFIGMVGAVILMIYVAYQLIFSPSVASVAPFLPFTEVPVLGYISFSHWIITLLVIVIVHEGGHGIVSLAHGLKVKKTGFGLFAIFIPFLPAAFVEPDDKKINKASDVVQYSIFAAGPMANFILMIPLILIFLLVLNPIESNITEDVGFSFNVIDNATYPAHIANISSNLPFNQVNGVEMYSMADFYRELTWSKPGDSLNLGYLNQSTNSLSYNYTVSLIANPDNPNSGFLGVHSIYDYKQVKSFALPFSGIFSWVKGLMLLLLEITFSLGLINLFPAMITDGGRMFSLALDRTSKNKERNKKIVAALGMFFLILILFAFVTYFTGNPFALFAP